MGQILRYYQEFFLRYIDFRGCTRRAGFWYVVLIIWFCLEGTPGDNEYGPDPKYS